ncbi:MAG: hypothetical protein HY865_27105 [Chloroflexi bacterium]|nr:hypothetical protein [Chloroflexota bacterium]
MYDYMLEEMAETIARELHVDSNDVLRILNRYWQDRIAHVWDVDDMLASARRAGKPITRADAAGLLSDVFEDHDSDLGINWGCLASALEDYHFIFKSCPEDQHDRVHGVFNVWRKGNPIAHQFGAHPRQLDGNLPAALDFAKSMATEMPGKPVCLGLETETGESHYWLVITCVDGEINIEESGEPCTP